MSEQDAGRSSLDVELEWPSTQDTRTPVSAAPAHLAPPPEATGSRDGAVAPPEVDVVMQVVEELREDLRGLREAVLDWPDPAELRTAVNELRSAVVELRSDLFEGSGLPELRALLAELRDLLAGGPAQELGRELAEMRALLERGAPATEFSPVREELSAISAELVSLRRRISLRAKADPPSIDDQVEEIAAAVIVRLRRAGELPDRSRR